MAALGEPVRLERGECGGVEDGRVAEGRRTGSAIGARLPLTLAPVSADVAAPSPRVC